MEEPKQPEPDGGGGDKQQKGPGKEGPGEQGQGKEGADAPAKKAGGGDKDVGQQGGVKEAEEKEEEEKEASEEEEEGFGVRPPPASMMGNTAALGGAGAVILLLGIGVFVRACARSFLCSVVCCHFGVLVSVGSFLFSCELVPAGSLVALAVSLFQRVLCQLSRKVSPLLRRRSCVSRVLSDVCVNEGVRSP